MRAKLHCCPINLIILVILGAVGLALSWPDPVLAGPAEMNLAIASLEAGEKNLDRKALDQARKILAEECLGPSRDPLCEYYLTRLYLAEYSYWSQLNVDTAKAAEFLAKAEAAGKQAITRRPNDPRVHVLMGRVYQFKLSLNPVAGLTQAALSESPAVLEFQRALELDPNNGEAEMGLGIYYQFIPSFLGGDGHRAREHFKRAAGLMPANPEPQVWIAISYREDNRLDDARTWLNQALALEPENRFARQEAARLKAAEEGAR